MDSKFIEIERPTIGVNFLNVFGQAAMPQADKRATLSWLEFDLHE